MSISIPRVFCVGMNYDAHVKELKNSLPGEPVIFMKAPSCVVPPNTLIPFPSHGQVLHHEVEVVVQIGMPALRLPAREGLDVLSGFTLGLDLTLRDLQNHLRAKGLPWEASKSFDMSAPLGEMMPVTKKVDLKNLSFKCKVNGEVRQKGNTKDMLFPIASLVACLSRIWTLQPGDLIFTGTPSGIGPLVPGDEVEISGKGLGPWKWKIDETPKVRGHK